MKLHDPEKIGDVRIGRRIRHQRIDGAKYDVVTKIYCAIYKEPNGKWSHESLGTSSKREARRKAHAIQARLDKCQERVVYRSITIDELIEQYQAHCEAKGLVPKSLAKYRSDLSKLSDFSKANNIRLARDFEEKNFHAFRRWLSQKRHKQGLCYSEKSIASAQLVTKQMLKWAAIKQKLIPTYTLAAVPMPKAKARPQPCFSTDQVEQLLALAKGEERAALATLAYSGMRVGELEQLLWEDVLFDRGELGMFHIRRGGSVPGKTKNRRDRVVPIHPRVRPLLEALDTRHDLVFPAIRERQLLARLKQLCRAAGFSSPNKYKTHSLRHHFCSMCANHQVAYRKALAWMGHHDSSILSLYYHLSDYESESAMKALAEQI